MQHKNIAGALVAATLLVSATMVNATSKPDTGSQGGTSNANSNAAAGAVGVGVGVGIAAGGAGGSGGAGGAGGAGGQGGTVVGSGNSANQLSQGQGQSQTATGGKAQQGQAQSSRNDNRSSASNANSNANAGNNAQTDVNVGGDSYAASRIPVATAYAPNVMPTAPCKFGVSGGGQGMSFGFSVGVSITDENCVNLEQVRTVATILGQKDVAAEMMKGLSPAYAEALQRMGRVPASAKVGETISGTPVYTVTAASSDFTDPIIRARLGLPPLK
jgi:hypothetical protein